MTLCCRASSLHSIIGKTTTSGYTLRETQRNLMRPELVCSLGKRRRRPRLCFTPLLRGYGATTSVHFRLTASGTGKVRDIRRVSRGVWAITKFFIAYGLCCGWSPGEIDIEMKLRLISAGSKEHIEFCAATLRAASTVSAYTKRPAEGNASGSREVEDM
jgi:hypothetical protein